jgi:predicted membrane-bound spermidine synthase
MIDSESEKSLFINGRFQIDSLTAVAYHQALAFPPMILANSVPQRILILGGGDGVLAGTLRSLSSSVDSIDLVDIDPGVVAIARQTPWIRSLGQNALSDWPKVRVHYQDAMSYLRSNNEAFDAIYIDLTYPYEADSTRFYSLEFFRLVARHLKPQGFAALGTPADLVHTNPQDIDQWTKYFLTTLNLSGFVKAVGYNDGVSTFVMASPSAEVNSNPLESHHLAALLASSAQVPQLRAAWDQVFSAHNYRVLDLGSFQGGFRESFTLFRPGFGTVSDSFY